MVVMEGRGKNWTHIISALFPFSIIIIIVRRSLAGFCLLTLFIDCGLVWCGLDWANERPRLIIIIKESRVRMYLMVLGLAFT